MTKDSEFYSEVLRFDEEETEMIAVQGEGRNLGESVDRRRRFNKV